MGGTLFFWGGTIFFSDLKSQKILGGYRIFVQNRPKNLGGKVENHLSNATLENRDGMVLDMSDSWGAKGSLSRDKEKYESATPTICLAKFLKFPKSDRNLQNHLSNDRCHLLIGRSPFVLNPPQSTQFIIRTLRDKLK